MRRALLGGLLVLLAGCGPSITVTPITDPGRKLQQRKPEEVEIIRARPERRYLEIANIVVEDSAAEVTPRDLMRALKEKAGSMGCDAVLATDNRSAAGGSFVTKVTSMGGICIVWDG